MGRKSLQSERRAQILDACESVVLEDGLAAASPARVARQIGLDRTTVHHYFRTQAELLAGLVERIVDAYLGEVHRQGESQESGANPEDDLRFLFSPGFSLPRYDRLVDEFAAASHHDPEVRRQLQRLYRTLERSTVERLLKALPDADPQRVRETAFTIYALIEGAYLLNAHGFPDDRLDAARRTAHQLVRALRNDALACHEES